MAADNQAEIVVPPPVGGNINQQLNIVIIGGGVTGVLLALELARAGYTNVTLLEQGGLGNGSSSRSAACIRQQFGTPSTVKGMIYATRYFRAWEQITHMTMNPLTQNGYLFLHDWRKDPDEVWEQVGMQREAGLREVEFLTAEDLEKFEDGRFHYISTAGIKFATWCQSDGFLQPHIIYNDGAEAAKNMGVHIVCNTPVIGAEHKRHKITAIVTKRATYKADVVVNATNAWTRNLQVAIGGKRLPIKPYRRYLYFLKGLGGENGAYMSSDEFRAMPMIVGPNGAYSHPTPGGELMLGWLQATKRQDMAKVVDQDEIESGFGPTLSNGYGMAMALEVGRYLPEVCVMAGAGGSGGKVNRILHATSGFYGETPDKNPFLDWDRDEEEPVRNLLHAAGFSGHGLMHAPFTARIVTELIKAGVGNHLDEIELPGLGKVDLKPYHTGRDFKCKEGMQI